MMGDAVPREHVVEPDRGNVEVREVMAEHDERPVAAEDVQRGDVVLAERVDPPRHQQHAPDVFAAQRELRGNRVAEIEPVEQQPRIRILALELLQGGTDFVDVRRDPVRHGDHVGRRHGGHGADRARYEVALARNCFEPPLAGEALERALHHLLAHIVIAHDRADGEELFPGREA